MDWTVVHSIVDNDVDGKRWRFLVDNCEGLFKDLRKVKLTNVRLDEIKLSDLKKLSSLRYLNFALDENSVLKNQLKRLVDANKELLKFVHISWLIFDILSIFLLLSNFLYTIISNLFNKMNSIKIKFNNKIAF